MLWGGQTIVCNIRPLNKAENILIIVAKVASPDSLYAVIMTQTCPPHTKDLLKLIFIFDIAFHHMTFTMTKWERCLQISECFK